MAWYLKNAWPENFFPKDDVFFGRIQSAKGLSVSEITMYQHLLKGQSNIRSIILKLMENIKTFDGQYEHSNCMQKPVTKNVITQPYGQNYAKACATTRDILDEMFIINENGHIITDEGICLDTFVKKSTSEDDVEKVVEVRKAKMAICTFKVAQKWTYNAETMHIISADNGECLEMTDKSVENEGKYEILLNRCDKNNELQQWILVPVEWK
jgi:polypeptide N-acetylgalactosaminyltransferase